MKNLNTQTWEYLFINPILNVYLFTLWKLAKTYNISFISKIFTPSNSSILKTFLLCEIINVNLVFVITIVNCLSSWKLFLHFHFELKIFPYVLLLCLDMILKQIVSIKIKQEAYVCWFDWCSKIFPVAFFHVLYHIMSQRLANFR